ncbi:DNA polymerase epsilon subunit 4 [Phlebotomus argentipes]|uniref:DNA polymerase epsilon subunit 4 n=1 Tax=Phlebotomus argentipes TaxID=94469 RepID=UPI00289332AA|nr:DNA polymerase epsilon subunit 4 [Phlebotomus argentipes]
MDSEDVDLPSAHVNYDNVDDLDYPELYLGDKFVEPSTEATEENPQDAENTTSQSQKLRLPVSKIKNMMKLDQEAGKVSLEALVLATKATEMFLDALVKEAFTHTMAAKKKTLQKNDVDMAISSVDALFFLEGCFKT